MSAALLAVAIGAMPASASDSWHIMYTTDAGDKAGYLVFDEHGDIVRLCDNDSDGYYMRAYYNHQGGDADTVAWLSTKGHRAPYCAEKDYKDHNLPENRNVHFTIWAQKDSRTKGTNSHTWYNDY